MFYYLYTQEDDGWLFKDFPFFFSLHSHKTFFQLFSSSRNWILLHTIIRVLYVKFCYSHIIMASLTRQIPSSVITLAPVNNNKFGLTLISLFLCTQPTLFFRKKYIDGRIRSSMLNNHLNITIRFRQVNSRTIQSWNIPDSNLLFKWREEGKNQFFLYVCVYNFLVCNAHGRLYHPTLSTVIRESGYT